MVIADEFSASELKDLSGIVSDTCISLYTPTFRSGRETLQGSILLKGLLKQAETALESRGSRWDEIEALLGPASKLLDDADFWQHQKEGLALFVSQGFQKGIKLPINVPTVHMAGDAFHITPLLPLLSGDGRFYILAVSENEVRLLDATRYGFQEVDVEGVPMGMAEALWADDHERQLQFHSGAGASPLGGGRSAMFFGTGDEGGMEQHKVDYKRYFDKVDAALAPTFKKAPAPVVLAGVSYLLQIYRAANTSANLPEGEVHGNKDRSTAEQIHGAAWEVAAKHFAQNESAAVARFRELRGTGLASDQPDEVIGAAESGRVDTLFVAPSNLPELSRMGQSRTTIGAPEKPSIMEAWSLPCHPRRCPATNRWPRLSGTRIETMLQIIINSDSNIELGEAQNQEIKAAIESRLSRFEDRLTRVVVHVRDENAQKDSGEDDKRCMIEARPEGMDAINVSHNAPTMNDAVGHAARKLERLLNDTFERLEDPKGRQPMR